MKRLVLLIWFLGTFYNHTLAAVDKNSAVIRVEKAAQNIVVDGMATDKDWSKAEAYPLSYVYNANSSKDKQASNIKMLWDDSHLYFLFNAEDRYLTARETERDGVPYYDDCFEVFLMPSAKPIKLHYGFEVNLNKTANDFIFLNDFYQNSKVSLKSYNPSYQVETRIEGSLNDNSDQDVGWSMELAIPIQAFHSASEFAPLAEGSVWNIMIIRQDRNDALGDRTSISSLLPLTEHIDVHEPKVFGQIKFVAD